VSGKYVMMARAGDDEDGTVIARSLTDAGEFSAIFDRHFQEMHLFVARRLGSDLADDVAADVFVEAFRCRDRYDVEARDARPWLYGITNNLVRRHRRTEVRRHRAYARHGLDVDTSEDHGVAARVDATNAGVEIATAIARLRARDRDALLLQAWADLSYEQIAVALDIPVGTVRSRLHRARGQLQRALTHSDAHEASLRPQAEGNTG
jgi:RNA polymerase sigma factor (sigma-70 family)